MDSGLTPPVRAMRGLVARHGMTLLLDLDVAARDTRPEQCGDIVQHQLRRELITAADTDMRWREVAGGPFDRIVGDQTVTLGGFEAGRNREVTGLAHDVTPESVGST